MSLPLDRAEENQEHQESQPDLTKGIKHITHDTWGRGSLKQDGYRISGNGHGEPAPTLEGLRKALLVAMIDPRNVVFGLGDTLI